MPESHVLHEPVGSRVGNRRLTLAAVVACAACFCAILACGWMLRDDAMVSDFSIKNLAPDAAHPFGTDWMGRDMLCRTVAGLAVSLGVGLVASVASSCIALVLACVSVLGGRTADAVVSWLVDLVMGIPHIVLLLLISYALGKGFWGVTIGLALTHWPSLTVVLRSEARSVLTLPYIETLDHLGVSRPCIAMRHVLPALLPQLFAGMVLTFPHAILHEASITFLGFGLSPDKPAIGAILSESMGYLSTGRWWLAVFPGLALAACVMVFDAVAGLVRHLTDAATVQE